MVGGVYNSSGEKAIGSAEKKDLKTERRKKCLKCQSLNMAFSTALMQITKKQRAFGTAGRRRSHT